MLPSPKIELKESNWTPTAFNRSNLKRLFIGRASIQYENE